jgi:ATP-dependent Clp protease ATP-binding subunit ClpB
MEEATEAAKEEVLALLKQTVRPEFINRIDEIVMFTRLAVLILLKLLVYNNVTKMLALQGITMDATSHAIAYLAEKDMTRNLARPVKRVIQRRIEQTI